jgi:hypothetical protein
LNTKDLIRLDVPLGATKRRATDFIRRFRFGGDGRWLSRR